MDVFSFFAILVTYIWVVLPATGGEPLWYALFSGSALAVAVISVWRRGATWERVGLRLDNLLPAVVAYLGVALPYAGAVLLWHREWLGQKEVAWPGLWGGLGLLGWAFLQEFCLLAFLLDRLRAMLGREPAAILAAAGLFAFFHLPNPFLTLYTLGGGLILAWLFGRLPNLFAATLAHAAASALVGGLLPGMVTGWMKVGPLYWLK